MVDGSHEPPPGGPAGEDPAAPPMRVVIVGIGIFPFRVAGDKNFFLTLGAELRRLGVDVRLLSIAEPPGAVGAAEGVTYLPRPLHPQDGRHYSYEGDRPVAYHHRRHGTARQLLELSSTLAVNRRLLHESAVDGMPTAFHWIDLSLVVPVLRRLMPRRAGLVVGALKWVSSSGLEDVARARALDAADVVLVPNTAAETLLRSNGATRPQVAITPWGCGDHPGALRESPNGSGRLRLLWAGFIQQIAEADFFAAHEVACAVVSAREDVEFEFCLKPESYDPAYASLNRDRIAVTVGGSAFYDRLPSFDALFSPVLDQSSIVGPPLTWIEAMSAGLPVVTTRTPGVDELVAPGVAGSVSDDFDELRDWLSSPGSTGAIRAMRPSASDFFASRYHIGVVAQRHLDAYQRAVGARGGV